MDATEMQKIVESVTAALSARTAPPTPPITPLSAMQPAFSPTMPVPTAVLVPLMIGMPDGSEVGVYVQLDGSAVQSLPQIVGQMIQSGWPVRSWQPKQQGFAGWGNNRGFNRGWRR